METLEKLDREAVENFYRTFATPGSATLVIAGDIEGFPAVKVAESLFGDWKATEPKRSKPKTEESLERTTVLLVNRPGSVQSQVAVGHLGLRRNIADYPAVVLLTTATGGLFNSRLNMKLREEKGFTYGAFAQFQYRREAGPFFTWAAVNNDATADAVVETIGVLRTLKEAGLIDDELTDARNYQTGVFPLRFETPEGIAQAIAQLVTYGLPDDYFDEYRPSLQAVTLEEANAAAKHLRPDRLAVVVVGDADQVGESLSRSGVGPVEVVEDTPPGN